MSTEWREALSGSPSKTVIRSPSKYVILLTPIRVASFQGRHRRGQAPPRHCQLTSFGLINVDLALASHYVPIWRIQYYVCRRGGSSAYHGAAGNCADRTPEKTKTQPETGVVLRTLALPRLPARRSLRTTTSRGLIFRSGGGIGTTLMSGGMRHSISGSSVGSARGGVILRHRSPRFW